MTDFVTLFYYLVFLDTHEISATYLKFLEAQLFINKRVTPSATSSFALIIVTNLSFKVSLIMNLGKKHNDYPGLIIRKEKN